MLKLFIRFWMCYETRNSDCLRLESPAACSLVIGGIGSPNTARPNGGANWWTHLRGISRLSHTCWKDLFYSFMAGLWRCVVGARKFSTKKNGRTITGTITKRYSKVTRGCLGPPLAQLLAFEALFYNATTFLKPAAAQQ